MKVIPISEIKGGEILAKDIYMDNGAVLMSEGATLRTAYIDRLRILGFDSVYIVDEEVKKLLDQATEQVIQKQCRESVIDIIDRYSYGIDTELTVLTKAADNIMKEVLSQPEVLYNVSRVRDKSESSYLHSINVAALSVLVGMKLNMPDRRLKNLVLGALLHDIGIIYVPLDVSKINIDECAEPVLREMRKHVIYGYTAVEREEWLPVSAKDIIVNHHERLDGSGYPFHLTSEKISLETKIVALCDEFDSRVYGNYCTKKKVHETMDYIISQAGVKFGFKVVQIFASSVAVYPIGTTVVTGKGETAVVVRQNASLPIRPVVKIKSVGENSSYKVGDEIDLTKELTTKIIDTID